MRHSRYKKIHSLHRAREAALVPDHWKAAVHFPLVEKDLVTARVKPTADGTVPKISFKPEKAALGPK